MNPQQLEVLVIEAIDQIRHGHQVEDDRVELKRDWPDPRAKARQLAGAANKANGDDLIYIIGVDEKTGQIHSHGDTDPAAWWAQMSAAFDEVGPELVRQISVAVGSDEAVTALLFSTDRAPYLVKLRDDGPSEREVPFRDGTRTRSARRAELLRMLIPQVTVPRGLLLSASVRATLFEATAHRPSSIELMCEIVAYLEHIAPASIFLPSHESNVQLVLDHTQFPPVRPNLSDQLRAVVQPPLFGVHTRRDGVVATGPGTFGCSFKMSVSAELRVDIEEAESGKLRVAFGVAGSERRVQMDCELVAQQERGHVGANQKRLGSWALGRKR